MTFSAYAQNYSGQGVWLQLSHSGKDVTLMFMLMLLISVLLMFVNRFNVDVDVDILSRFLRASGGARCLRRL